MDTYHIRKQIHRLPGKVIHAIPIPEPEVREGHQSRQQIGEICRQCGYNHVLLVTDKTLCAMGYEKAITESLEAAHVGYTLFNDINSEPTISIIEAGRQKAMESQAECVIALGGGSVLDTCKMIAASVKMPHLSVKALLLKFLPVPKNTLPIIAVPSTAGTGAEVTVGAVVLNEHGVKSSTVLIGLNVTHVVLDSELTIHAPQKVTAACGMDALSHCIEGAVSDVEVDEEDMHLSMEGVKHRSSFRNVPGSHVRWQCHQHPTGWVCPCLCPQHRRQISSPSRASHLLDAHARVGVPERHLSREICHAGKILWYR